MKRFLLIIAVLPSFLFAKDLEIVVPFYDNKTDTLTLELLSSASGSGGLLNSIAQFSMPYKNTLSHRPLSPSLALYENPPHSFISLKSESSDDRSLFFLDHRVLYHARYTDGRFELQLKVPGITTLAPFSRTEVIAFAPSYGFILFNIHDNSAKHLLPQDPHLTDLEGMVRSNVRKIFRVSEQELLIEGKHGEDTHKENRVFSGTFSVPGSPVPDESIDQESERVLKLVQISYPLAQRVRNEEELTFLKPKKASLLDVVNSFLQTDKLKHFTSDQEMSLGQVVTTLNKYELGAEILNSLGDEPDEVLAPLGLTRRSRELHALPSHKSSLVKVGELLDTLAPGDCAHWLSQP